MVPGLPGQACGWEGWGCASLLSPLGVQGRIGWQRPGFKPWLRPELCDPTQVMRAPWASIPHWHLGIILIPSPYLLELHKVKGHPQPSFPKDSRAFSARSLGETGLQQPASRGP